MTEPLFRPSSANDPDLDAAHANAAATMPEFLNLLIHGSDASCMAKLRFRDPDLSEREGEDRFFFLWLSLVQYDASEALLSGAFFEVPSGFEKWHAVGSRLEFELEDVFDWMVIKDGRAQGGFTIRATRSRLPESERAGYDSYLGISSYAPVIGLSQQ